MRKVLIVSPHFPPVNAPDMHRLRISLPYYREFGWEPTILTVTPSAIEGVFDPELLKTIPENVTIHYVNALPVRWTEKVGVRNIAFRSFPFLYRKGCNILQKTPMNLVFFTTTMFPVMTLGRIWKKRFKVPYVLDFQDPWYGTYYDDKPRVIRPKKYWVAQRLHKILEPWTVKQAAGIIAVSQDYIDTLHKRYSSPPLNLCRTIPFGATFKDFEWAANLRWKNPFFNKEDGLWHGVYAGVLGPSLNLSCRSICIAFRKGLKHHPSVFSKLRLHFVGTDYSSCHRKTIEPMADKEGIPKGYITEEPNRIPYLEVLRLLQDSDFLIVPGSDNSQYTASKIYPYILAKKPLLAVFHKKSSVVEIIESIQCGHVVSFQNGDPVQDIATRLLKALHSLVKDLPYVPLTNWNKFEKYTARELTRQQCELFDQIIFNHLSG